MIDDQFYIKPAEIPNERSNLWNSVYLWASAHLWDLADSNPDMCIVCLWAGHPAKHIKNTLVYPNLNRNKAEYRRISWETIVTLVRMAKHLDWTIKFRLEQIDHDMYFPATPEYTRLEMRIWTQE